jgi:hypothetical protein
MRRRSSENIINNVSKKISLKVAAARKAQRAEEEEEDVHLCEPAPASA